MIASHLRERVGKLSKCKANVLRYAQPPLRKNARHSMLCLSTAMSWAPNSLPTSPRLLILLSLGCVSTFTTECERLLQCKYARCLHGSPVR